MMFYIPAPYFCIKYRNELMAPFVPTYQIDGIDLSAFGIRIAASRGVLDLPSMKQPQTYDWPDYHGVTVDLEKPRFNPNHIILDAWMESSDGMLEFAKRIRSFYNTMTKPGLRQLLVFIGENHPLVFMVYMKDGMDVQKKWNDIRMFGTFQIKLEEPEPVKMVVRFESGSTVSSVSFASNDFFNVYWGDGTVSYDIDGVSITGIPGIKLNHNFPAPGTYFACVCGNIDSITSFSTTGTVIWQ